MNTNGRCALCHVVFRPGKLILADCGHFFHCNCLIRVPNACNHCPVCFKLITKTWRVYLRRKHTICVTLANEQIDMLLNRLAFQNLKMSQIKQERDVISLKLFDVEREKERELAILRKELHDIESQLTAKDVELNDIRQNRDDIANFLLSKERELNEIFKTLDNNSTHSLSLGNQLKEARENEGKIAMQLAFKNKKLVEMHHMLAEMNLRFTKKVAELNALQTNLIKLSGKMAVKDRQLSAAYTELVAKNQVLKEMCTEQEQSVAQLEAKNQELAGIKRHRDEIADIVAEMCRNLPGDPENVTYVDNEENQPTKRFREE